MAAALIFIMRPLILGKDGKYIPVVLAVMSCAAAAYLCFVEFYPFPADIQMENLVSGRKNAYTLLGALLGFLIVYFVDEKKLKFQVKAVWWAQIVKTVLGLGFVLAIKEGLSKPLASLLGQYPGRAVRYFLIVLFAGVVWPLTFRWFSSLGQKK